MSVFDEKGAANTVRFDVSSSASLRKVPSIVPAFFGLGFYWAWVGLAFFSGSLIPETHAAIYSVELIWAWCTVFHVIALLGSAFLSYRVERFLARPLAPLVFSAAMAIGTLCVPISSLLANPLSAIVSGIGIAVMGVSGASVVLMWGMAYRKLSSVELFICTFVSYLLMGFIHLLSNDMSSIVAIITAILLPILSGVALFIGNMLVPLERQTPMNPASSRRVSPRLLLPFLALFFFAFCGELLRGFSLESSGVDLQTMGNFYHLGGAIGSAALLLILLPFLLKGRLRSFDLTVAVTRPVFLIMAGAFMLVSFFDVPFTVSYAIFSAGFHCFRALAWIFVIQIVQKLNLSAVRAVGLTQGAIAAAPVFALLFVPIFFSAGLTSIPWDTISLAFLFFMFVIASFLLNNKDVEAVWGLIPRKEVDLASDHDRVAEHEQHTVSDDLEKMGTQAAYDDAERITVVLNQYGLSPREMDVALLLAKGRSLPFIKDELVISLATAQTHQRHIYQKINVHSRQEFLDVLESGHDIRTESLDSMDDGNH